MLPTLLDTSPSANRPDPRRQDGMIVLLSVLILTKNEENNLEACLETLRWCRDIHVVDSCSTDLTVDIAKRHGVTVHQHAFEGHTRQREWALRHLPFKNEWLMALDADHRVTPDLQNELVRRFQSPPTEVNGFYVKRRQIFRGRWLQHGGYYPKFMLKVFRHRVARLDHDEFDYRFYVEGSVSTLDNDILEENRNEESISFFVTKHNRFATEQAEEELKRRNARVEYLVPPSLFGTRDQRTLWLKKRWYALPLYWRPFLLFTYRYVLRLGFLDGKEGLIFHFLQSLWFRILVDIRIEELAADNTESLTAKPRTNP
jgi:glycosyltransferase involved in cell wall biosynthesis